MRGLCVLEASSKVMNADVDVLDMYIVNSALGNTCSPARQEARGLGGIGRPISVLSLRIHSYRVRLRHLLAQTGSDVITLYLILMGQLSCQDRVCFRLQNLFITAK